MGEARDQGERKPRPASGRAGKATTAPLPARARSPSNTSCRAVRLRPRRTRPSSAPAGSRRVQVPASADRNCMVAPKRSSHIENSSSKNNIASNNNNNNNCSSDCLNGNNNANVGKVERHGNASMSPNTDSNNDMNSKINCSSNTNIHANSNNHNNHNNINSSSNNNSASTSSCNVNVGSHRGSGCRANSESSSAAGRAWLRERERQQNKESGITFELPLDKLRGPLLIGPPVHFSREPIHPDFQDAWERHGRVVLEVVLQHEAKKSQRRPLSGCPRRYPAPTASRAPIFGAPAPAPWLRAPGHAGANNHHSFHHQQQHQHHQYHASPHQHSYQSQQQTQRPDLLPPRWELGAQLSSETPTKAY